jgi:hypothetical protein
MLKQLWNGPEVLVLHKEFSFQQQVSQHLVIGFRVAANFGFFLKRKICKRDSGFRFEELMWGFSFLCVVCRDWSVARGSHCPHQQYI